MAVTMSAGFLILCLVVGLTLAVHGTQKLFGWFAGPGLARLKAGFEKKGLQAGVAVDQFRDPGRGRWRPLLGVLAIAALLAKTSGPAPATSN